MVNYLNKHGYKKLSRGEDRPFTYDSVTTILDNPFYCGKILYNRRSNEPSVNRKKKEVITVTGNHEPIVTEEQWNAVHAKRMRHRDSSKKKDNPERISLLSGLVKCPKCGAGMIAKKNKSVNHNHGGYYKTLYYYSCNNNRKSNGRTCDFNHTYNQKKLDGAIFEIFSSLEMIPAFRQKVLSQLGSQDAAETLETEMKNLCKQLRSKEMRKRKLGEDLDSFDIFQDDYDREYDRIQSDIDHVYDSMEAIEAQLDRKKKKLLAIQEGIQSADKITGMLEHMKQLYEHMTCEERRKMYRLFINSIEVWPEHSDGRILKRIAFNIPVFYGNEEVTADRTPDEQIVFTLDCSELELTASEAKATYVQIRGYILEKYGKKVSSLYIAQIKRKYGIDMGENYNKPEDPKARVPKCPKEKE